MSEFAKQIAPVSLENEMKSSYLDYAMSVIVGRALPDVRDGLKPVHRRVLFVMDKNQNVTLPMVLQTEIKDWERCSVYKDKNWVETKSNCYPITKKKTDFAGLKSLNFDVKKWISEVYSVDYLSLYQKLYENDNEGDIYGHYNLSPRRIINWMMRVGYLWDVIYMLNNDFAHFSIPNHQDSQYIYFNEKLKK